MTTSNPWTIDHIGIAVSDMDQAIALYASHAATSVTLREKLEPQGVEIAFLNTGSSKVELLAAVRPDTPIGRFLAKRGPGLHHICYRVSDIKAEMSRLAALGATLIDKEPRSGAAGSKIAFISPDSFSGVLTELCEYPES
jgi:methylmalonyl-CoA/ethylmalonyl-CoA epimerase